MGAPARRLEEAPALAPPLKVFEPAAPPIRRRSAAAARQAILSGFATVGVVWLLSLWLVSRGALGLPDPAYGKRTAPLRELAGLSDRPLTVVTLGSSRTGFGIRDNELAASLGGDLGREVVVANLSEPLMGPRRELLLANRLKSEGLPTDLLLLEIFPLFLSGDGKGDEFSEERLPLRSLSACDLDIVKRHSAARQDLTPWDLTAATMLPPYDYRFEILRVISRNMVPKGQQRYAGATMEWRDEGPKAHTAADLPRVRKAARDFFYDDLQKFELGDSSCAVYRELVALCKSSGIRAALVLMPESPEFRTWYRAGARDKIRAWVNETAREYGVPLIDAWEWSEEEDFCDGHHLTTTGARRFEARLRSELVPLLEKPKTSSE
jgi:hypothetical protein